MLKLIISFTFGAACAFALCWFGIYPVVARDKFEFGVTNGYINARSDIAQKIRDTLGDDHQRGERAANFYSVEDVDVLVVTRYDVKTLRLYRDR